jgi:hypothetical protein
MGAWGRVPKVKSNLAGDEKEELIREANRERGLGRDGVAIGA